MKYEILYLYNIMRKNKSPVHLTNIWLIWFLEHIIVLFLLKVKLFYNL